MHTPEMHTNGMVHTVCDKWLAAQVHGTAASVCAMRCAASGSRKRSIHGERRVTRAGSMALQPAAQLCRAERCAVFASAPPARCAVGPRGNACGGLLPILSHRQPLRLPPEVYARLRHCPGFT
eukprot:jgi/Ulvmu1/2555/UM014_0005.1